MKFNGKEQHEKAIPSLTIQLSTVKFADRWSGPAVTTPSRHRKGVFSRSGMPSVLSFPVLCFMVKWNG